MYMSTSEPYASSKQSLFSNSSGPLFDHSLLSKSQGCSGCSSLSNIWQWRTGFMGSFLSQPDSLHLASRIPHPAPQKTRYIAVANSQRDFCHQPIPSILHLASQKARHIAVDSQHQHKIDADHLGNDGPLVWQEFRRTLPIYRQNILTPKI
jgi:hypothetical protein